MKSQTLHTKTAKFLNVNRNPFIVRSIEDHQTVDYKGDANEEYLKTIKELNANTVSVTFRWSFFEKNFGVYDTTILRQIKKTCEKYGLKVIILWFGSNISGHESLVPQYIRNNPDVYTPYLRKDGTVASKTDDAGLGHIYCYSFNARYKNSLLERERKALQELMKWITVNDREETYIMLQLENELFVHPELWRPWPPIYLSSVKLPQAKRDYVWDKVFNAYAGGLDIRAVLADAKPRQLHFAITDTTGKTLWQKSEILSNNRPVSISGDFINQRCRLAVGVQESSTDTMTVNEIRIKPIAQRCYCDRCQAIYASNDRPDDRSFEQTTFLNYIRELARAVGGINPDFPQFLNLLVSGDAKTLLGNPYYQPRQYLDSIPEIDILGADIYLEELVPVLDSLAQGRNVVFVPEAGQANDVGKTNSLNAFSLIFEIIGNYRGVGVQIYDLKNSQFSLLSPDGQWTRNAYLVRNSYSAIGLLPADMIYDRTKCQTWGFRNMNEKYFKIKEMPIKIKAIDEPRFARGLVIKTNKQLILCGVGFQAEIYIHNINKIKLERGFWKENNYVSLGELKPKTYIINPGHLSVTMDIDDFSSPGDFDVLNNQYCVIISIP